MLLSVQGILAIIPCAALYRLYPFKGDGVQEQGFLFLRNEKITADRGIRDANLQDIQNQLNFCLRILSFVSCLLKKRKQILKE